VTDCVVLSLAAAESDKFKDYCHGHILPDQEKIPYIKLILTHWQKMTSTLLQQTVSRKEQPVYHLITLQWVVVLLNGGSGSLSERCKLHPEMQKQCSWRKKPLPLPLALVMKLT